MKVNILSDDGVSDNAQITLGNGEHLPHVRSLTLRLAAGELVTAECTFILPGINVIGEVTVREEHLRELAAAHGYELKRKSD